MTATPFAPIAQVPQFMPFKSQEVSLDELIGVSANVVQELGFMIRSARSSEFLKLESMRRKLDSCMNSDSKCVCKKCVGQD
ncbi:MAG: hypothetical protein SFY67_01210 [Candidatus Melainabacteria bacterium]|nr:hypothetical protein [Candidatus Melainabacteria bacterium]